jgi:GT2 family glycosyltransferase
MKSDSPAHSVPSNSSVSVIVVTWNGRHHLETCLPALIGQTLLPDEVIVVDNGSDDGTAEWLKDEHVGVKLVALQQNRGFAGGNLAGLEAASGEYIVLLNNDTRPEPAWLERLVRCAQAHPGTGMIASHMTDWDGDYTDSAGDVINVLGRAHQRHKGRPLTDPPESDQVFSACAGAALYRRRMIEDVGFLDETFFMNVEDSDLAFRAQLRGWSAHFCADAIVRHRVSASQVVGSASNVFYNARNYVWSYYKNMPRELILKYGWLLLADLALKGATHLRQGTLRSYLSGLLAGVRGIPARRSERHRIQASRKVPIADLERTLSYPRLLGRLMGKK